MEYLLIKVSPQPEPASFDSDIRKPGARFLAKNPRPTAKQFARYSYWRRAHHDLYKLYSGICAYCASWSPFSGKSVDGTSVDHFIPKSIDPNMAYEWKNYRLCRSRLNEHKTDTLQVVDPFFIQDGWFTIDFLSFLLKPNRAEPMYIQARVLTSIQVLDLNHKDYVSERISVIAEYCRGHLRLDQVKAKWPFIAAEMLRQNFDTEYMPKMISFFRRMP